MSRIFRCQNCFESYIFWNGIGFSFPQKYNELFTDALSGKYGERLKELLQENPNAIIDAATSVYVCEYCRHWIESPVLDCYLPAHKMRKQKKKQIWAVSMPIDINNLEHPVVPPWELRKGYKLLERYKHICPKCSSEMKMCQLDPFGLDSVYEELSDAMLRCPICGGDIVDTGEIVMID